MTLMSCSRSIQDCTSSFIAFFRSLSSEWSWSSCVHLRGTSAFSAAVVLESRPRPKNLTGDLKDVCVVDTGASVVGLLKGSTLGHS